LALDHDAVSGNPLAGLDEEDHAGLECFQRNQTLAAILHQARLVGHQSMEQRDGTCGAILGAAFDRLAGAASARPARRAPRRSWS
jgi:hypothetical protein